MNAKCCEIGDIQAFLDGELSPARSAVIAGHVADCDACAMLLASAEEEMSLVFPALEREMDTLVPTHRLWTRINDSIAEQKRQAPFWRRFLDSVLVQIASPSIAAAAVVIIVFGLFAGVWSLRSTGEIEPVQVASSGPEKDTITFVSPDQDDRGVPVDPDPTVVDTPRPVRASYSPAKPARSRDDIKPAVFTYLPGEESYVKTIANLSETVDSQKDIALRPSARVDFERDMAVVNDAIRRMRSEVRKNPKNESAKQVLYTSYQNKIDLLNSVAEREELVASLR
jgi:hypothetical protein